MMSTEDARKILGEVGGDMTQDEIDKLLKNLYALVGQVVDNEFGEKRYE